MRERSRRGSGVASSQEGLWVLRSRWRRKDEANAARSLKELGADLAVRVRSEANGRGRVAGREHASHYNEGAIREKQRTNTWQRAAFANFGIRGAPPPRKSSARGIRGCPDAREIALSPSRGRYPAHHPPDYFQPSFINVADSDLGPRTPATGGRKTSCFSERPSSISFRSSFIHQSPADSIPLIGTRISMHALLCTGPFCFLFFLISSVSVIVAKRPALVASSLPLPLSLSSPLSLIYTSPAHHRHIY
jgi:hypothetical protein